MFDSKFAVKVHPQVMFVISDHSTRCKFSSSQVSQYPCGILLGSASGNTIEILDAYEILVTKDDNGNFSVDQETYSTTYEIKSKVFSYVKIGWFISKDIKDDEMEQIGKVIENNEDMEGFIRIRFISGNEINHMMDVTVRKGNKFVSADYSYESELGERIALMQMQSQGTSKSQVEYMKQAYKALDEKMAVIENYLSKMISGEVAFDPVMVKKINDLNLWFNNKDKAKKKDTKELEEQGNLTLMCGLITEKITRDIKEKRK